MFFTLSGFLIATRLFEEYDLSGRISLRQFYVRRARRLLPALFALLAVCSVVAANRQPLIRPAAGVRRGRGLLHELVVDRAGGPHGGLSHTWSLAIEEQFYLVWPLLFLALCGRRRARAWLLVAASGGFVASLIVRLSTAEYIWRATLGSDSGAGEVLAGVLLALLLHKARPLPSLSWLTPIGFAGCLSVALAPPVWAMTWGLAVSPICTAAMILGCVGAEESVWLQARPLVWLLGERSYGFYLWHFPITALLTTLWLPRIEWFSWSQSVPRSRRCRGGMSNSRSCAETLFSAAPEVPPRTRRSYRSLRPSVSRLPSARSVPFGLSQTGGQSASDNSVMLTRERWRQGGDLREAATRVALVGAWAATIGLASFSVLAYIAVNRIGVDAHAYWLAGRTEHPYNHEIGDPDAFLYSPLFAQLIRPLAALPWWAFVGLIMVAESVCWLWLLRPLPPRWRVPALLACVPAVMIGNIHGMLGVALVFSLSRPGLWAFPALTKVTPSGVGAMWFVARGEWRNFARAAAVTLLLAVASFAWQPHLWFEWFDFLVTRSALGGTLGSLRILAGLVLAAYAGRSDRRWLLAVATVLTLPLLNPLQIQRWVMLAPIVRLSGTTRPPAGASPSAGRHAGRTAGPVDSGESHPRSESIAATESM